MMEPAEGWLENMGIRIDGLSPLSNWSVWKVPNSLRTVNEDAYNPHIISIGPLHHAKENVQSMEVHKLYYMQSLLQRTPDLHETLRCCGRAINEFDVRVRSCYAEPINYGVGELAEILLVDGCFILELFIRYSKNDLRLQDDPLFRTPWMILSLQRDLALLENQIPFFVLERLYSEAVESSTIGQSLPKLPELALAFFESVLHMNDETQRVIRRPYSHLLDLIHKYSYRLPEPVVTDGRYNWREQILIQPATTLSDTGIKLQKCTSRNLFHLEFQNGVLKIPSLFVHDATVSLFQNLIAYEQLLRGTEQYVTSYFLLMSFLVSTVEDAELLLENQIIVNSMGGWKDFSTLFNDMCKQVFLQDFHYAGLCKAVNSNLKNQLTLYKRSFRRNYFRNPRTTVLTIAGIILLILMVIQTAETSFSVFYF